MCAARGVSINFFLFCFLGVFLGGLDGSTCLGRTAAHPLFNTGNETKKF